MPCYHPLLAYQPVNELGRREGVSFKPLPGAHELFLPCGKCIGCRMARADAWATRVMHEAQLHEANCFVTLTYRDSELPENGSIRYDHFQLFMKRLRKKRPPVRFYMCGEYGEQTHRPHYHAAFFGLQFSDLLPFRRTDAGLMIYTSATLDRLWTHGHCSVGELTRESAAYIARYVMKKISGPTAENHYRRVDPDTGEIHNITPEFTRMSLKPGIGFNWIRKYHADVYPSDTINTKGRLSHPPRYYDKQMEAINADALTTVQAARYQRAILTSEDNTAARLKIKHDLAIAKNKLLKRSLE